MKTIMIAVMILGCATAYGRDIERVEPVGGEIANGTNLHSNKIKRIKRVQSRIRKTPRSAVHVFEVEATPNKIRTEFGQRKSIAEIEKSWRLDDRRKRRAVAHKKQNVERIAFYGTAKQRDLSALTAIWQHAAVVTNPQTWTHYGIWKQRLDAEARENGYASVKDEYIDYLTRYVAAVQRLERLRETGKLP